jgi:hypothetical protein
MLLYGYQISEYLGLSPEGWRQRRLKFPELYGCIETRSHGAGRGYVTAFETTSLDYAEPIVQAATSGGRRAARLGEVVTVTSAGAIDRAA